MKTDRLAIFLAVVGLLVSVCAAFVRSTVPLGLDDDVVAVGWVSETGYRLRTLELADGRVLVVDRDIGDEVGDVAHIDKDPWAWQLEINGRTSDIWPGEELWRLAAAHAAVVAAVIALTRRRDTTASAGQTV